MKKIKVVQILSYSCLYPHSNIKIEDMIKLIPSQSAIEWASYMFLRKSMMKIDETEHGCFLPLLFNLNKELQSHIVDYLQKIDIKNYVFIDKVAMLILIQYLIANHNDNKHNVLDSKDDFSNLMIAYLLCCDEMLRYTTNGIQKINDIDSFVKLYLPEQLKYNDIHYSKDYRVEFLRFYYFMGFCENDSKFRTYLNLFLTEKLIEKWDDYLYFVFETYLKAETNADGSTNKFIIDPSIYYGKAYMDAMCIDILNFKRTADFTCIRERPIYCQGNNTYSILCMNFFLDKLFQSFLFDFANVLRKYKHQTGINNYPDLKKMVGEHFTECYLFYEIMNGCFGKTSKKSFSGKELKVELKEGEPDYYVRKGKNIFLFEFKDVMLDAKTKHCEDFDKIQGELLQLFESSTYEKNKNKIKEKPQPKGITQLLNVIDKKLNVILQKMDVIECADKFNVYPIIVYQDCSFDIEGFNYILKKRFVELQIERNISDKYLLKDLVMLPLEGLIKLEDYFIDGKLQLEKLIDGYIIECSSTEENKILSFYKYLMSRAMDLGYNHKMSTRFKRVVDTVVEKNRKV